MKKVIAGAMSLSMLLSGIAVPAAYAADTDTAVGERQLEDMNRGVVAVPTSSGVFLSWRLQADEDVIFGSADENVAFDIYRDGEKIATEENTTNYLDANGTKDSVYRVVPTDTELPESSYEINGDSITVNATRAARIYAVKYDANGSLSAVKEFETTERGTTVFSDIGFTPDKVYMWNKSMDPNDLSDDDTALMLKDGYLSIPLDVPEDETITDSSGNSTTYSFKPTDCSAGDLDGDGEYEIVVKFVSNELDVGSSGYSGTTRFNAYKLDGTKLWEKDINLGQNVYSSAHTAQFLVYDFDGDGKAEMTVQTSLGSTDGFGEYVSKASATKSISSITDEKNATADYRAANNGRVTSGEEFLTVFDGETGKAIDTITYPTARYNITCWGKSDGGNRSLRFLGEVAYLDGEKPYAVYWRGYYNHENGRTGVAGISFDGERLSVDYQFDTLKGQKGYTTGNEKYAGEGNHNLTVADVDNDGKDEVISGAMCMEVDDNNKLNPRWCTYKGHGDAMHIGDYDPTHEGYEFFTVHEEGGGENNGVTLDYGASIIDANTGEILKHWTGSKDTARGMMANVGSGGYYQITASSGVGTWQANGNSDFTSASNGMGNNFRVFWDGDLYDELLNGTTITSWNGGSRMSTIFTADNSQSINGSKDNPSLQADLFGDWREEVVYPSSDNKSLNIFTTTTKTDYKIKSLMYDSVYRSGVAAEQTAYNQPPHIGFYLDDSRFHGKLTGIEVNTDNAKKTYYLGEELDKSGITVTGKYSNADDTAIEAFSVSGYDPLTPGEQEIKVEYLGFSDTYTVEVIDESSIDISIDDASFNVGEELDKSAIHVQLNYADGTSKEITNFKVSGYDSMTVGEQTITVTCTGAAGNVYTASLPVYVVTDFTIEDNVITGYTGSEATATVPNDVTQIADGALSSSPLTKIYIYNDDIVLDGDSIFPTDITIACHEGSAAYEYAVSHNITTEIISAGDEVTFDEDFYSSYAGGNMLMQSENAATLADKYVTYNTTAADSHAPWYKDNMYGFSIKTGDSNYLSVSSGVYDEMNAFDQVYITLNESKQADEKRTLSFDIMIPKTSTNSPYAEVQNASGEILGTISALTADTWYTYTVAYNGGEYTATLTSADGTVVSENQSTVSGVPSCIAFKQGYARTMSAAVGVINIDNIIID